MAEKIPMHISCTICTDVLEPDENLHATKCGHVFHNHCLSDWNMRSNTCPQCRSIVLYGDTRRIYPTFSDEKGREISSLQSRLSNTIQELSRLQADCEDKETRLRTVSESLKRNEESLEIYVSELDKRNLAVEELATELERVKIQNNDLQRLRHENESMAKSMRTLEGESLAALKAKLEYIEIKQENKRLEQENRSLKKSIDLLNGELRRQNLLYNELMSQVSLQKECLETQNKEIVRLKDEKKILNKCMQSLNREIQRSKLLNNVSVTQVSPEHQKLSPEINEQVTPRLEEKIDYLKENIPNLSCMQKSEFKKIEPQDINVPDQANVGEKFKILSQKLKSANASQANLRRSLMKLTVAWLKLKQSRNELKMDVHDSNSSLCMTSRSVCDNDNIDKLINILSKVDNFKLNENTQNIGITLNFDIFNSNVFQNINQNVCKDDEKQMTIKDYAKLIDGKTQEFSNVSKEKDKKSGNPSDLEMVRAEVQQIAKGLVETSGSKMQTPQYVCEIFDKSGINPNMAATESKSQKQFATSKLHQSEDKKLSEDIEKTQAGTSSPNLDMAGSKPQHKLELKAPSGINDKKLIDNFEILDTLIAGPSDTRLNGLANTEQSVKNSTNANEAKKEQTGIPKNLELAFKELKANVVHCNKYKKASIDYLRQKENKFDDLRVYQPNVHMEDAPVFEFSAKGLPKPPGPLIPLPTAPPRYRSKEISDTSRTFQPKKIALFGESSKPQSSNPVPKLQKPLTFNSPVYAGTRRLRYARRRLPPPPLPLY